MKKSLLVIFAFAALAVTPVTAQQTAKQTPAQQYNALKSEADKLMRGKKTAEALAVYEKAAAVPGISPAEKLNVLLKAPEAEFRSNFPNSGFASYTDNGINNAMAMYRKLLDDKTFTVTEKIELYKRIADCLLELMKVDEANAELAKAVVLAKKSAKIDDLPKALFNQAAVYARQLNKAKAIDTYRSGLKIKGAHQPMRFDAARRFANLVQERNGKEAALKELSSLPDLEYIVKQYTASGGSNAEKIKHNKAVMADTKNKMQDRANAARDLLNIGKETGDIALIKEVCKTADEIVKADPKKYAFVYANSLVSHPWGLRNFANNPEALEFISRKAVSIRPDDLTANTNLVESYLKQGNLSAAAEAIKKALVQEKLAKNQDLLVYQAVLDARNTVLTLNKAKTAAKKVLEITKDKSAKDQAKALQFAARFANRIGDLKLAKGIWAERGAMLMPEPKRQIACPFLENGPESIAEYLAGNYLKNVKEFGILDRKYGDNLQFLLDTDATITSRQITENKDPAAQPTRFVANCDVNGLKLFFIMPCAPERAANLKLGYGGFGGYEMYLATGYDMPYYCFLIDAPPANTVISFDTQYSNKDFRQLSEKSGNMNYSFKVGKDSVYMLLEISWSAVLDKIPVNGSKWEFEPIHWERGGWSWGGSKSVHNRSSFGLLVFENMTEANRTKIKRALLPVAQRAYNKELNSRNGGILEHWADPELGDPVFNQKVIVPFMKKYGDYVKMIQADMTDAEVNRVFDEAYYTLVNTRFIVQKLRSDYLKDQLTAE